MKMLVLMLLLFIPTSVAFFDQPPLNCTNVLEFIKVLVPAENRHILLAQWRTFLNTRLKNNIITMEQYDARKDEILEAKRIIIDLENKGYKGNEIISITYLRCSV